MPTRPDDKLTSPKLARKICALIAFPAALLLQAGIAFAHPPTPPSFPAWAYPWDPSIHFPPDDGVPRHVPESVASFTVKQIGDLFFSPDWHPDDHPPIPDVVNRGRKPDVRACGSCHQSEGAGGPENASLAGLPAAYIVQQMADYKSGARGFSGPRRAPALLMIAGAKAATDAEVHAAAAYFASLKPKPVIKVIETDTVPKTYVNRAFVALLPSGGTEPIGKRIVEVPKDVAQFEARDPRTQFIAYVPVGNVARGEALAKTGGEGTTVPCAICHGPELKGVGPIPRIAGRSPSYIARQLFDMQQGTRAGSATALMKPTVEKLSGDDINSLAAYVASLEP